MNIIELSTVQQTYKAAVDTWIDAIRAEEALALEEKALTLTEVDAWEQAHYKEEDSRNKAMQAKKEYENVIRQRLFNF